MSTALAIVEDQIKIGDVIQVGEFFWIDKGNWIGFDADADHGHGLSPCGSVDVGCTVTVRGIEGGMAVVRLDRPGLPCGAPAAIGAVFQVPLSQIKSWEEKLGERIVSEKRRKALAERYCR